MWSPDNEAPQGARCIWDMNISNIRESAEEFHLLFTTGRTQVATMTLPPGGASSDKLESHPHSDQVTLILKGEVVADVGGERTILPAEHIVVIPAGVKHRFVNESADSVFAFVVYGPPAYETDDPT